MDKFTGLGPGPDLQAWLTNFEHCCTITEKIDNLIQGQLLMLSVEGRALAILERLKNEKGSQMKYSDLKKALKAVFDSPADREAHTTTFETRLQGLNETEEEFMLILVKLYKAANPKVKAEDLNRKIKRKLLYGIPGPLRHNLFIFCNNPLDDSVSHQDLLQAARDAKVHLSCSTTSTSEFGLQQQPGSIDLKQPGGASHTINSIASASPDKTFDAVFWHSLRNLKNILN